ncbi:MAG: STAS domain-containing protein [Planctomycetes bacterium]|nr:STAS domain-containing protein [Planctomycetota bacterium]
MPHPVGRIFIAAGGDVVYARIEGLGSRLNVHAFRGFTRQALAGGFRRFVIDLSTCEGLDSTSIGVLIEIAMAGGEGRPASLVLANAGDRVRRSLEDVGVHTIAAIPVEPIPDLGLKLRLLPNPPVSAFEQARMMLDAHKRLLALDPANREKFAGLIGLLRTELGEPATGAGAARFDPVPLKTVPILKQRVWGGERLRDLLGKAVPAGGKIGESWEVTDHGAEPSPIAGGSWRGRTIRDLIAADPSPVLGAHGADPGAPDRLPLLLKFLDAQEDLSVQVHPGDADAVRIGGGAAGKAEAWLVLAAEPGAKLVHGLAPGISWEAFFRNARAGHPDPGMRWVPARPGDVFFNPPGTVHALGSGIVVVEIQQTSDTTYRIHDWGRVGLDGAPRPLHLDEAEAVTPAPPIPAPYPVRPPARPGEPEILADCPQFRFLRLPLDRGQVVRGTLNGARFALLTTIEGSAVLTVAGREEPLALGESWLLPAALGEWTIRPQGQWVGLWMEPGDRR